MYLEVELTERLESILQLKLARICGRHDSLNRLVIEYAYLVKLFSEVYLPEFYRSPLSLESLLSRVSLLDQSQVELAYVGLQNNGSSC